MQSIHDVFDINSGLQPSLPDSPLLSPSLTSRRLSFGDLDPDMEDTSHHTEEQVGEEEEQQHQGDAYPSGVP